MKIKKFSCGFLGGYLLLTFLFGFGIYLSLGPFIEVNIFHISELTTGVITSFDNNDGYITNPQPMSARFHYQVNGIYYEGFSIAAQEWKVGDSVNIYYLKNNPKHVGLYEINTVMAVLELIFFFITQLAFIRYLMNFFKKRKSTKN